MRTFGLTGGIGMGKSAATAILRARQVPVVDTDELARELVEPGQPALAAIRDAFGPEFVGADGRLRRGELARLVFAHDAARRQLEGILHPPIRARWRAEAARWRTAGAANGVVVIPLLFETGAERELDVTVCVACSSATQRARLAERGWTPAEVAARVGAQVPIARKMALADHVLWNDGPLEALEAQLGRIFGWDRGAPAPPA